MGGGGEKGEGGKEGGSNAIWPLHILPLLH